MWDIKLKTTKEQISQTNKQKLIDTENSIVVTRGKGVLGEVVKCKGHQTNGERFDFGS